MIITAYGSGAVTRKTVTSLLDDTNTAGGELAFVLPADEGVYTDAVRFVADWAFDHKLPLHFLHTPSADLSHLEDFEGHATTTVVNDPLLESVRAADSLWIAFNEEDPLCESHATLGLRAGCRVYDLTDLLYEVTSDEELAPLDEPTPVEVSSSPVEAPAAAEVVQVPDEAQSVPAEDTYILGGPAWDRSYVYTLTPPPSTQSSGGSHQIQEVHQSPVEWSLHTVSQEDFDLLQAVKTVLSYVQGTK